MNRDTLEGIIRGQLVFHEQVHDDHIVALEELISAIADAIEAQLKRDEAERLHRLAARMA